jgi:hypothetical protein
MMMQSKRSSKEATARKERTSEREFVGDEPPQQPKVMPL